MSRLITVIPLALIVVSFMLAPYVWVLRVVSPAVPPLPTTPHLLYRHDRTAFFYTSADLLHPDAFGLPRQYIEAVVFDVLPAGEGVTREAEELTWVVLIWKVLMADIDVAARFREAFGGAPRLDRGQAAVYELPAESAYRRQSGLRLFSALAIRLPPPAAAGPTGAPQLFPVALERALRQLRQTGVDSVGVPRMVVRTTVGGEGSRAASWGAILRETDVQARAAGMRTVLFGGWGVSSVTRELTDAAFRSAWESHRRELAAPGQTPAHEQLRLGALIALVTLLRWHRSGGPLRWARVVALAFVAAGLAVTIASAARWLGGVTHVNASAVLGVECMAAAAVGLALERVVAFDPKKILAADKPA